MFKISDFILPKSLIQAACRSKGVGFIDLEVSFERSAETGFVGNKIVLAPQKTLEDTYWQIISIYFRNFPKIHGINLFNSGRDASAVYFKVQQFINKLFQDACRGKGWESDEPVVQRLYQYPLAWIIIKDLICPVFDRPSNNTRIIFSTSPLVDVSKYYNSDELDLDIDEEEADLIFLNSACVYAPLETASLIVSAIEAHNLCPKETLLEIEGNLFLKNKLKGAASVYFTEDEKLNDFMDFLYTFAGVVNKSEELVSSDNINKEAQASPHNVESNWWFFGLIEKMLEPARGSDKEVHETLEQLRDVIQVEVEKTRQESGREGANYEKLLRAIDSDESPSKYVILEKTLSKDRLW